MASNSNNDGAGASQSFGLVPLFPLPQLQRLSDTNTSNLSMPINSSLSMAQFGNFLPPIFSPHYDSYAVEELAPIEMKRILSEVVSEEILNILEKLFDDGGSFLDVAISHDIERRNALEERASKAVARQILDEVVHEASQITVDECLNDLIQDHSHEIRSRLTAEYLMLDVINELLYEIGREVVDMEYNEEEFSSVLEEVVQQELREVVKEALTDCGARHAFSQYKHMTQFASEYVLDGMCMEALLPATKKTNLDVDFILDHVTFSLLLNKIVELNQSDRREGCYPIEWYMKKLLQHIALDAALDELCEAT